LGIPSRQTHKQFSSIQFEQIENHKEKGRWFYFLSVSACYQTSREKFGSYTQIIDSRHPQKWVDVDNTLVKLNPSYSYSGTYEYEYIADSILYAAIQSFVEINQIDNPFYLPIDLSNQAVTEQYKKVYKMHADLCAGSYQFFYAPHQVDLNQFSHSIQSYVNEMVALYQGVRGEDNPFNLSCFEFGEKYPAYTRRVTSCKDPSFSEEHFQYRSRLNKFVGTLFKKEKTVGEHLLNEADVLLLGEKAASSLRNKKI
jgi:hypothetical protein